MHRLQQIQIIGNFCLSLIGFSSFIIIINYIRLTSSSCSKNAGIYAPYSCTAYHSFQANAAISFFLIFVPWAGMIGSLRANVLFNIINNFTKKKKMIVYLYLTILSIILIVIIITCAIIFTNNDVKGLWQLAKDTDSTVILAVLEGLMTSYNMLIAQIILVWIFLVGTGIITFFARKKQEEEGANNELLQK